MNNLDNEVFSEYEIKESSMKFPGDEKAARVGCVGSLEETLDSKQIKKKCEGVESIVAVRGKGTGSLKTSLHIKYGLYIKAYGMHTEDLVTGVNGYGKNSIHKSFSWVGKVTDENGNEKLKAYPNCLITDGVARKIENGGEEVAEIEMTITLNPDENGYCMYEALIGALEETDKDEFIEEWMTAFKPEMVKKTIPTA